MPPPAVKLVTEVPEMMVVTSWLMIVVTFRNIEVMLSADVTSGAGSTIVIGVSAVHDQAVRYSSYHRLEEAESSYQVK